MWGGHSNRGGGCDSGENYEVHFIVWSIFIVTGWRFPLSQNYDPPSFIVARVFQWRALLRETRILEQAADGITKGWNPLDGMKPE